MCILSIKVLIRKKSVNISYAPRIYMRVSKKVIPFSLVRKLLSTPYFSTVTVFLNSDVPPPNKNMYPPPRKILLTVLWATFSLQFSLPPHWHNVFLLNPLLWDGRNENLKALNQVNMEDAVKLSTRMRRLSPLSSCLCMVEHCQVEGGHYLCLNEFY